MNHFALLAVTLLIAPAFAAQPGDVLESFDPRLNAPADLVEARLDAHGQVCLLGGFATANGDETGGVVRLAADGSVDAILAENLLPPPSSAWVSIGPVIQRCGSLMPLSDGRLLLSAPKSGGVLIARDGGTSAGFLTGLPAGVEVFPQFERDGFLYLILRHGDGSRSLVRQDCGGESWQPEVIASDDWPLPPAAAVAGHGMTIRILGFAPHVGYPQIYQINPEPLDQRGFLVEGDGTPVAGSELQLDDGRRASLDAGAAGGYRLTYGPPITALIYWPQPEAIHQRIEWRDDGNRLVRSINLSRPLGTPLVLAEDAGGRLLTTGPDGMLRRLLADGSPDPEFAHIADVRSVLPLPDGRVLLNGTMRVLANGETDPTWEAPDFEESARVSHIHHRGDGSTLIAGNFRRAGGGEAGLLARINSFGEIDPEFAPALPDGVVWDLAEMADGGVVVAGSRMVAVGQDGQSNLLRFLADGTRDLAFQHSVPANFSLSTKIRTVTTMPDGRLLVTTYHNSPYLSSATLGCLMPNGQTDPDFHITTAYHSPMPKPLVMADGTFFLGSNHHDSDGQLLSSLDPNGDYRTHRALCLMPDGAVIFATYVGGVEDVRRWKNGAWDPQFVAEISRADGACPGPGGKVYVWSAAAGVARLHRTGGIDVTFRGPRTHRQSHRGTGPWMTHSTAGIVPFDPASGATPAPVTTALSHPVTGNLWIAGSFNIVAGEARDGIAVVDGGNPTGYDAWIAAALRDAPGQTARDADPDGDGVPNWLEYATGGDPLRPNPRQGNLQRVSGEAMTYVISRNPDAPEVQALIEVSEDLANWRIAGGSEIILHSAGPQLRFTLLPAAGARFARVRFTQSGF